MNTKARLYAKSGEFIKELDLPIGFIPQVIFYGTRAFLSLLPARGEYCECACWRATEDTLPEAIMEQEQSG